MTRDAKSAEIGRLAAEFGAKDALITEYRGLTAAQLGQLRAALRGCATFTVTKNTLARKAAAGAGLELSLAGPTAVAFVTGDTAAAARALDGFARDHPALVLKGGVVSGQVLDPGAVRRLEPRAVLLARLAGAMKAQTTRMALLAQALHDKREDDGEAQQ
jgi:large subunit ribosomal protein L10